ncbi:hypothetical protein SynROS8604_02173 [Synechococcus sp. ROS8604]|nr:hypothetical protein SynROS8604_02173 [Synechococcus sp. ROS8604]
MVRGHLGEPIKTPPLHKRDACLTGFHDRDGFSFAVLMPFFNKTSINTCL